MILVWFDVKGGSGDGSGDGDGALPASVPR